MTPASGEEKQLGIDRPQALREYALLADGERGIGRRAAGRDYVWMCAPRWDSERRCSPPWWAAPAAYTVTPAVPLRVGWLLRAAQLDDLAQPVDHR